MCLNYFISFFKYLIKLQHNALNRFEASNNVPKPENWFDFMFKFCALNKL